MAYQKINWENKPSTKTPIKAENLNHMEDGIEDVSLNKADAIISSDSGTTIVARDSAEFPLNGLAVYGRSEQETTSGKNLFDIETARDINNYDLSLQGYGFCVLPIKVPSGSDITVSVDHTARTDDYLAFSAEYGADVPKNWFVHPSAGLDKTHTFEASVIDEYIYMYAGDTLGKISAMLSEVGYIQVEAGSTATAYEPYTGGAPSPSPDYPQPIVNAGRGVYTGKNLFDINQVETIAGSLINNGDGTITVIAPPDSSAVDSQKTLKELAPLLKSQNTYTLSADKTGSEKYIYLYQSSTIWDFGTAKEVTETMLNSQVFFYTNGENTTAILSNIQIEFGSKATSYEPYTGGVPVAYPKGIEVAVMGKNLFNTTGREVREPGGGGENYETRNFNGNGIYVGITMNNYYYPYQINSYEIEENSVSVNTASVGYGIGFDFKIIPGQKYIFSNDLSEEMAISFYTKQGVFLSYKDGIKQVTATAPSKAYWMIVLFRPRAMNVTVTYTNIQLEPSSTVTAYEPYRPRQTVTLASENGLPGIPVEYGGNYTDADGQQWICDTVEYRDGQAVYVQRVEEYAFTGNEDFIDYLNVDKITSPLLHKPETFALCTHAVFGRSFDWANDSYIVFKASAFNVTTVEEFETWVTEHNRAGNPLRVLYVINTPTETPLTDTEAAQLATLQSYKPTTVITNDAGAGMDVEYTADTKNYIDNKFAELQTALAVTNAQLI